ncbi:MAG: DNA/RNA non-specific endonuclease, partial [Planctomycetales bacterium]|nr:DNA/RNA non-specific endonuclease [Planctomycetales bacterium]
SDGGNLKALSRRGIDFRLDNRVPSQFQAGNELYSNNPYDRGHMARRADLTWGPVSEARRANKDSFFFTNITPQNETFNQSGMGGVWGKLENAIMEDVEVEDLRVSVLAGPVFKDDDVEYRSVQIPRNFWKLIAFRDTADDRFKVAAYILGQSVIEALDLNEFRLYHVSLNTLSHETGLSFDELTEFDTFDNTRETLGGRGVREIRRREDIL